MTPSKNTSSNVLIPYGILSLTTACFRHHRVVSNLLIAVYYRPDTSNETKRDKPMPYSPEQIHELDVLIRYNLESTLQGLKVHRSANPEVIEAMKRLYQKGLVTEMDGGYLTDLGHKAAEHAQTLLLMLAPATDRAS